MARPRILITGPPGTGKTTLARRIARDTGIPHVDVTQYIREQKLYSSYDPGLDTLEFDDELVAARLAEHVSQLDGAIIDTHSPSVGIHVRFDRIFLLRCTPGELIDRLGQRGYSKRKIDENVQCLHFDVVGEELDECYEQEVLIVRSGDGGEPGEMSCDEAAGLVRGAAEVGV